MIVIGYSADRYGDAALEQGIAEAGLRGSGLLVVNATRGDALTDKRFAQGDQVQDLEQRLAESGVKYEIAQPVGVDVVEELLEVTERADAELLVIGIRHRTPVGKLLLGSVAQQLILRCSKPVLAVKPAE
ncbi:universal stress protein [Antrihabitans sp. YC2-6]|uniref:universal stress protein n=1 Tax=Antrihabitans sp. YC2-6 TaxID=2799498 RepID=UPI0018F7B28C|nr:universal stress protein [Antrihabitans sp. YC2-6]MBJ8343307.1 universal stress protein [Antrihabitans sp. YC2-6]